MSIVIEIYMLMLKSATDVGILRLTAGCEWDSLQRFVDGVGAVPLCPPALLSRVRYEKTFCFAHDGQCASRCR